MEEGRERKGEGRKEDKKIWRKGRKEGREIWRKGDMKEGRKGRRKGREGKLHRITQVLQIATRVIDRPFHNT